MIISKEFMFEASHVLPLHPGKCANLHGHSWRLRVSICGQINPLSGFVMDYAILKRIVEENVVKNLDHTHLGVDAMRGWAHGTMYKVAGCLPADFYPTSENLVMWVKGVIEGAIEEEGAMLYEVSLDETCTSRAIWRNPVAERAAYYA